MRKKAESQIDHFRFETSEAISAAEKPHFDLIREVVSNVKNLESLVNTLSAGHAFIARFQNNADVSSYSQKLKEQAVLLKTQLENKTESFDKSLGSLTATVASLPSEITSFITTTSAAVSEIFSSARSTGILRDEGTFADKVESMKQSIVQQRAASRAVIMGSHNRFEELLKDMISGADRNKRNSSAALAGVSAQASEQSTIAVALIADLRAALEATVAVTDGGPDTRRKLEALKQAISGISSGISDFLAASKARIAQETTLYAATQSGQANAVVAHEAAASESAGQKIAGAIDSFEHVEEDLQVVNSNLLAGVPSDAGKALAEMSTLLLNKIKAVMYTQQNQFADVLNMTNADSVEALQKIADSFLAVLTSNLALTGMFKSEAESTLVPYLTGNPQIAGAEAAVQQAAGVMKDLQALASDLERQGGEALTKETVDGFIALERARKVTNEKMEFPTFNAEFDNLKRDIENIKTNQTSVVRGLIADTVAKIRALFPSGGSWKIQSVQF